MPESDVEVGSLASLYEPPPQLTIRNLLIINRNLKNLPFNVE
jgi:hypothetical protein